MRKALIVGINYYSQIRGLYGCVHDAHAVKGALERNGDGTVRSGSSFSTAMVIAPSPHECASPWWAHIGKETERSALRHGREKLPQIG